MNVPHDEQHSPARIVSGAWLDAQHFPPLQYAIHELIAEGLTLLAGGPKIGKSWFTFGLMLAKASGTPALGAIPTEKSPCLLMALEDGYRRLQGRARHLLGDGVPIPDGLDIVIKGTYAELMEALVVWLDDHRDQAPVVTIDTLGRFRPPRTSASDSFGADYRFIGDLKRIIDEVPGGSMIVVHHTRKPSNAGSEGGGDFVDQVSGTTALSAAADATVLLTRRRHEDGAILSVTGRDVREAEYALVSDDGRWRLDGTSLAEAADVAREARRSDSTSDDTKSIVALVEKRALGGDDTRAADVSEALGIDDHKARTYLARAADRGQIRKSGRGLYTRVATVATVANASSTGERNTRNTRNTVTESQTIGQWQGSGETINYTPEDAA